MIKDIKDYLHLYVDAEFIAPDGSIVKIYKWHLDGDGICQTYTVDDRLLNWHSPSYFKPILRPLSDITDEESVCIAETTFTEPVSKEQKAEIGKMFVYYNLLNQPIVGTTKMYNYLAEFEATSIIEITRYLLSKHFDLFGLIEAGLAIDKTTIHAPTT